VNGEEIEEPYLRHPDGPASPAGFSVTVPDGRLFLLGDDRAGSQDSRTRLQDPAQGTVPRSAVEARLDAVAWPLPGGLLERPRAFAELPGGTSRPGPVRLILGAAGTGAVLILAGTAYGPSVRRLARGRRGKVATDAG
jgi:signal peptidase I